MKQWLLPMVAHNFIFYRENRYFNNFLLFFWYLHTIDVLHSNNVVSLKERFTNVLKTSIWILSLNHNIQTSTYKAYFNWKSNKCKNHIVYQIICQSWWYDTHFVRRFKCTRFLIYIYLFFPHLLRENAHTHTNTHCTHMFIHICKE